MTDVINKYELIEPMSNENSGFSKWGHAKRGDDEYFIKELLNPRYPTKDSPYDDQMKEQIRQSCLEFEAERTKTYELINKASDGNLMRIEEFFRWDGKYYVAMKWLKPALKEECSLNTSEWASSGETITLEDMSCFDLKTRVRVCLALSHAFRRLHDQNVVHADIKPSNIVLTKTLDGGITSKIIDMESSFIEGKPPEEILGDQVYFAPETIKYMMGQSDAASIGCGIDVFALGLIIHQILAGSLPELPDDYRYAFEVCLDGGTVKVSDRVPGGLARVIEGMLLNNVEDRHMMPFVNLAFWRFLYRLEHGHFPARNSLYGVSEAKRPKPSPVLEAKNPKSTEPAFATSESTNSDNRLRFGSGLKTSDRTPTELPASDPEKTRNAAGKTRNAGEKTRNAAGKTRNAAGGPFYRPKGL